MDEVKSVSHLRSNSVAEFFNGRGIHISVFCLQTVQRVSVGNCCLCMVSAEIQKNEYSSLTLFEYNKHKIKYIGQNTMAESSDRHYQKLPPGWDCKYDQATGNWWVLNSKKTCSKEMLSVFFIEIYIKLLHVFRLCNYLIS